MLRPEAVRLGLAAADRADAISQCGRVLLAAGAVAEPYLAAMHERERTVSTYVGNGVAIPHGTNAARAHVLATSLAVLQFPAGVDWDGEDVRLCVAIAADGDEHVRVLSALARVLVDPDRARQLCGAAEVGTVMELLGSATEEEQE